MGFNDGENDKDYSRPPGHEGTLVPDKMQLVKETIEHLTLEINALETRIRLNQLTSKADTRDYFLEIASLLKRVVSLL